MARTDFNSNYKRKRPGIVSKSRSSNNKNSKYYVKPYRGQGR